MKSSIIIFVLSLIGAAYANAGVDKPTLPTASQSTRVLSSLHKHGDDICGNAQEAAQLWLFENKTLGPEHAADHAISRTQRCAAIQQEAKQKLAKPSLLTHWLDHINAFFARFTTPAYAATGLPSVVGQWAAPFDTPIVGIHTTLMPNGKVLFWTYGNPRNDR